MCGKERSLDFLDWMHAPFMQGNSETKKPIKERNGEEETKEENERKKKERQTADSSEDTI